MSGSQPAEPRTWVLTGSAENLAATRDHGFTVVGLKEGRRNFALQMAVSDRVVFYVTKVMAFAASVRITGELYEDREKIWPGKPGKVDPYPWRFATEPELILDQHAWLPAETVKDDLDHIRKWPAEHWKLAFQGQMRELTDHDAVLMMERLSAAAGTGAEAGPAAGAGTRA